MTLTLDPAPPVSPQAELPLRGQQCLRSQALAAMALTSVDQKLARTHHLLAMLRKGEAEIRPALRLTEPGGIPGRPARPRLVPPREVPQRSLSTSEGRAALVHAVAHIEFNAVHLALDAVWRYAHLPHDFYRDWLTVAAEEALHFALLHDHLQHMGYAYGDFDAHDGLWEMAHRTRHDVLARMALVPRVLEARGLDVNPGISERLRQAGDWRAGEIMERILQDEIGHVSIGNHWFHFLCVQRKLNPYAHEESLRRAHKAPALRPPLNEAARLQAGFSAAEILRLRQSISAQSDSPQS